MSDSGDGPELEGFETVEANSTDDSDAEWIDLEHGEHVMGEVAAIREDCGEYDNRVYEIIPEPGERVCFWGAAHLDNLVDEADVTSGDVVFVENTGEQYETDYGRGDIYDLKIKR